jgi:hypothetical protein
MRICLVVALLSLGACKGSKLEWKPQVLTKVTAGSLTFEIPAGWRDISESSMPELAGITRTLGPNAHMIVRANDTNTDTNIAFMWADTGPNVTCEQIVDAIAAQGSEIKIDRSTVKAEAFGTDSGCSYHFRDASSVGTSWMRMHGAKFFTLQCLHESRGDADADRVCTQLAAALKAQ